MPAGATVSYVNGDEEMLVVQVFADPTSAAKYERWPSQRPPPADARAHGSAADGVTRGSGSGWIQRRSAASRRL